MTERDREGPAYWVGFLFFAGAAAILVAFGVVGVMRFVASVRAGRWDDEALTAGVGGIVIGGPALGLLLLLGPAVRFGRQRRALRARHPFEPWRWREDWERGVVENRPGGLSVFLWVCAAFWNVMAFYASFVALRDVFWREEDASLLMMLIFPLVGVGITIFAVRSTVRWRRYGTSRFHMATVPFSPAEELRGEVRLAMPLMPERGFDLTLTCTPYDPSPDAMAARIAWQEVCKGVPPERCGKTEIRVPVRFQIPVDALPTESRDPKKRVTWRLGISADVPGVDYSEQFEVPVFRKEDVGSSSHAETRQPAATAVPEGLRVTMETTPAGGVAFCIRPQRNAKAVAGPILPLAVLSAILVTVGWRFPVYISVPWALIVAWGLWYFLRTLVGSTEVTIEGGHTVVRRKPFGRLRSIPCTQIEGAQVDIAGQVVATPYYAVSLIEVDGTRTVVADGLPEKPHAQWLAVHLEKAIRPE